MFISHEEALRLNPPSETSEDEMASFVAAWKLQQDGELRRAKVRDEFRCLDRLEGE